MNQAPPEKQPMEWAALIMGLFLALGAAVLLLVSALLTVFGISALMGKQTGDPMGLFLLGGGTFVLGLLLLPGIFFNARKFFNLPDWLPTLPAFNDRIFLPVMIIIWLICLLIGQLIVGRHIISALVLPMMNILALGLPILFYIRLSLRGLDLPTARLSWSIFGASLLVSPTLATFFEAIAMLVIGILYFLYASSIPGLKDVVFSMFGSLQSSQNIQDEIMRLTARVLFAPGAAVAAFSVFSVATPLIEETVKLALIVFYLRRINHPLEGFVLGILCGAAFALSESIGYTSTGTTGWAINAAARASTALPHILNSGMLGWALVSAYKERRYARLIGAFLAAILLHGFWNAVSLALVMNGFSSLVADVPFYLQNAYPWFIGWIILTVGTFIGLIFNNRQMRNASMNKLPAEPAAEPA